jgi:SAM-dependent methyltransferase
MTPRSEARARLSRELDAGFDGYRNLADVIDGIKSICSGVIRSLRSINPIYRGRARRYLAGDGVKKLQIGTGPQPKAGWLNTDLKPRGSDIVYLDARGPLPFPNDSFDFIFAEHLIEHLDYLYGLRCISECRRVLKPGGVLRLATPNLHQYVKLLCETDQNLEFGKHVEWYNNRYVRRRKETYGDGPIFPFNTLFRKFGHIFLYTPEALCESLTTAGFSTIRQVQPTESQHVELKNLEAHDPGNAEFMLFETMVYEAEK